MTLIVLPKFFYKNAMLKVIKIFGDILSDGRVFSKPIDGFIAFQQAYSKYLTIFAIISELGVIGVIEEIARKTENGVKVLVLSQNHY